MTRETMLAYLRAMPEGQLATLPRDAVLRELDGGALSEVEDTAADYTLAAFAALFNRSVVTARQWCDRGLVPGAYKLQGRAWRIPRASVARFREQQALPRPRPAPLTAAHLLRRPLKRKSRSV